MSYFTDLPDELISETMNCLGPYYKYARLAQTCKQMNNRIWKFKKYLSISENVFKQYFATTGFNMQRYVGLECLIIPQISTQLVQLPRLKYLSFEYDGSADQATIINQLTHLYELNIRASRMAITNLRKMIGDKHQLTNLILYSQGCPKDLFQLPIINQLKALTLCPRVTEDTTLEELFNMTNLRKLSLEGIRVKLNDIQRFSHLINLQDLELCNVMVANEALYINFEEFRAMTKLTRLHVFYQELRQNDFITIGKLTSLESLGVTEYHNTCDVEYITSLTNLTQLELYNDGSLYTNQPVQLKHMTKLEEIVLCNGIATGQLQFLPRLTNLAILEGRLTADQANKIGLITQLRGLELSCKTDFEGQVDLSPLVNVSSLTMIFPYYRSSHLARQLCFGMVTQLKNMRELDVGDTIHEDMFDCLKQLTKLTKLNINCKRSEFAHKSWDLAALPFEYEFIP